MVLAVLVCMSVCVGYGWLTVVVIVVVGVVLSVEVEVALIVDMYVVIVVVITDYGVIMSCFVFGKEVKLALVLASGVLMITEDVVVVLEEDSAQRAVKVSSHVVFPGQSLQGSSTLSNLLCALITTQKQL